MKIDKEKILDHFYYEWWKYVVAILIILFVWNITSNYIYQKSIEGKKIEIYLVGPYLADSNLQHIKSRMLRDFPELKEILLSNIPMRGPEDMAAWQKVMTYIGSQTGDIYVFDKDIFVQFAKRGAFLPLESYLKNGVLNIPRDDTARGTVLSDLDKKDHVYGLPIDSLQKLNQMGFDTRDKFISVTAFSKKKDTSVKILRWIFDNLR
ncbi:hypothetical protein SAMN02746089_01977 [Caldanaerobius fijiensis DSM 17918]|uniref:Extracellular solute-binding protein n=1 Tax=Caldanaerobius fijiensis DSM 17918 TaxID=1121256 RepID=A0A1M5BX57_9THEO|nr:hypothetical protein [Caldanaerobius fijiensis]SHF46991.1 hypothetical protein SAMN02746089_01977 [Caldanaerobius fijiensis DSM 17918]